MGISRTSKSLKSGKKSDKETQSPVIKVFQEMIRKEKDPEKANLLKEKSSSEDRRSKQYSSSRSKSDRRTLETGSSDRRRGSRDSRATHGEAEYLNMNSQCRTHSSIPYVNEKRDSWWFWGETDNNKSEKNSSRVSCALKKIWGSDNMGICCLVSLFLITVIVAIFVVYKTMPFDCSAGLFAPGKAGKHFGTVSSKMMDVDNGQNGNVWNDKMSTPTTRTSADDMGVLSAIDFGDSSLRESSNLLEDSGHQQIGDFYTMPPDSSDQIRKFYKKLMNTNIKIRNLKQNMKDLNFLPSDENSKNFQDRHKRSARIKKEKKQGLNATEHSYGNDKTKRSVNNTDKAVGFVIEKKKVIVQFEPDDKKKMFPKGCNVHKESKTHDKGLKNLFYKNTQRLDELFDNFFKKQPQVVDRLRLETLLQGREKCKHPKFPIPSETKPNYKMIETNTKVSEENGYTPLAGFSESLTTIQPLEVSTIMSTNYMFKRILSRKLMQVDENNEQEISGNTHKDDTNKIRKKRTKETFDTLNNKQQKPEGVYNSNWKGPIPHYPDEINAMISNAVLQNLHRLRYINNKDMRESNEFQDSNTNDVQYIEDYTNNKYDKMAQAYSDYGVLEGMKQHTKNEKEEVSEKPEEGIDRNTFKQGEALRKSKYVRRSCSHKEAALDSEGLKFEIVKDGKPENLGFPDWLKKLKNNIIFSSKEDDLVEQKNKDSTSTFYPATSEILSDSYGIDVKKEINKHPNLRSLKSFDTNEPKYLSKHIATDNNDNNTEVLIETKFDSGKSGVIETFTIKDVDKDSDKNEGKDLPISTIVEYRNKRDTYYRSFNKSNVQSKNLVDVLSFNFTNPIKSNNDTSGRDLTDFVMIFAGWLKTLALFSEDDHERESNETYNFHSNESIPINQNITVSKTVWMTLKNKTNKINAPSAYPSYSSDMVDNIGHRSRVLLGFDELDNVTNKSDLEYNVKVNNNQVTNITDNKVILLTNLDHNQSKENNNMEQNLLKYVNENKTLVKRNTHEQILNFWNGIYDDEYGVKVDKFNFPIRGEHSGKIKVASPKPGGWIKRKVKKVVNKFHKNEKELTTTKKRISRAVDYRSGRHSSKIDQGMGSSDDESEEEDSNTDSPDLGMGSFSELSKNLKTICRQAADAVQQTRSKQVREDNKESAAATSLMQQLVRLMADLVDFQVQQRTCMSLPPDLQNFLEWLTSEPKHEDEQKKKTLFDDMKLKEDYSYMAWDNVPDKTTDQHLDYMSSSEREEHVDTRSECLGTLHAVQDLIKDYDDMTFEDKNKLSGVRGYLVNQLDFLNRQVSTLGDYMPSSYFTNQPYLRFKRQPGINTLRNQAKKGKRRQKRRIAKYIRHYGKKHTKPTLTSYDSVATEHSRKLHDKKVGSTIQDLNKLRDRRNLRDIYYRALAESKKSTTEMRAFNSKP